MMEKSANTMKILVGIILVLVLALAGFFVFTQYEQHVYVKQAVYTEEVASDARDVALGVKDLHGGPESAAAKDLLGKIDAVQGNLKKTAGDLKTARPGSKYRTANADLLEAVLLEGNILDDVENIIKNPLDKDTNAAIARVKENVAELKDRGSSIAIEKTDFASAFNLDGLDTMLTSYVQQQRSSSRTVKAAAAKSADTQKQSLVANFKARLQGTWGKPRTDIITSYDSVGEVVPNEPGPGSNQEPYKRYPFRSIENVTYDSNSDTYTADVTYTDGQVVHIVIRGNESLLLNGSVYQRSSGTALSSRHAVVDQ
ncbi:hypothetical protein [Mitsuokella sp. WILCCON 0060]|uniref:hypothetical protein n=1 Tax=unclassified Mitsuokella TaxID=2637239 RepID=UPI003EFC874E